MLFLFLFRYLEGLSISRQGHQFSVSIVNFHNTINQLTIQINNETSLETQQQKVYYSGRSKRVRVKKRFFLASPDSMLVLEFVGSVCHCSK